jgi:aspartate kinase
MSLKVLKFGGSSVGSVPALLRAADIVATQLPSGGLIVVSALQGTTDLILQAVDLASKGDVHQAHGLLKALRDKHQHIAQMLGLLGAVNKEWALLFERLTGLLTGMGMLWEASNKARDAALAIGETLSARLFTALLHREGRLAHFVDAREVLHTDARHGQARPRLNAIRNASKPWRTSILGGDCLVTQGFVGVTAEGVTTTLGRGGSDTSATLFGEALEADEVQIWTDVDGVLTADPSLVPNARPIPRLSVEEAAALSAFGAKVLHADSLAPVARGGFRLIVANTLRPEGSTTEITQKGDPRAPGEVTSVAYKEGLVTLRFGPDRSLEEVASVATRLQEAGATRFGLVGSPEGTLLVIRPEHPASKNILTHLSKEGIELSEAWALVALVGDGLKADPGHALRLLAPLEGETLGGLLAGAGGRSLAALIPESRLRALIPALHRACIETTFSGVQA